MPEAWAIDGVDVPARLARMLPYIDNGGAEGVATPSSMKVAALDVPSTQVRVLPGGALVRNRYPQAPIQSYVLGLSEQEAVPIVATGSSGARSDMLIARVYDPEFEPSKPAGAPFELIQDVSPTADYRYAHTLGYPAIALSRIDIPASTATITNDMVKDLRKVARPQITTEKFQLNPLDNVRIPAGITEWRGWPLGGPIGLWSGVTVPIPDWATYYEAEVTYTSVRSRADTYGYVRLLVGDDPTLEISAGFNTTNAGSSEVISTILAANKGTIPAALRGTDASMRFQGRLASASIPASAGPWSTEWMRVNIDFTFKERAA